MISIVEDSVDMIGKYQDIASYGKVAGEMKSIYEQTGDKDAKEVEDMAAQLAICS